MIHRLHVLIWTANTDKLMKLKEPINKVYPSIKFDFPNKEINFICIAFRKTHLPKLEKALQERKIDRPIDIVN